MSDSQLTFWQISQGIFDRCIHLMRRALHAQSPWHSADV